MCLNGKSYETFSELKEAVLTSLNKMNADKEEKKCLNSLITFNFQDFSNAQNLAA